jgi:hypothetical protein
MTRNATPAVYWVDKVGAKLSPFAGGASSVTVSSDGTVAVAGWIVDEPHKSAGSGAEVVIDGKAYQAEYGIARPDVANFKGGPAYTNSGFTVSFPAAALGKGTHSFAVRGIAADRSTYYSTPEWSIVVP